MNWPWRRFEAFYASFARRKAAEALDRRRDLIINGLYGSGAGGEELSEAVKGVDKQFDDYKKGLYLDVEDLEIDTEDPFFAAMKPPGEGEVSKAAPEGSVLYGFDNIEIEPG